MEQAFNSASSLLKRADFAALHGLDSMDSDYLGARRQLVAAQLDGIYAWALTPGAVPRGGSMQTLQRQLSSFERDARYVPPAAR